VYGNFRLLLHTRSDALPDQEVPGAGGIERFELTSRHAANRGICLSTNRKNRVLRVPATKL
jgi:hypothetical protein